MLFFYAMTNTTNTFGSLTEKVQNLVLQWSNDINQQLFETFLIEYKSLKDKNEDVLYIKSLKLDLAQFSNDPLFNILLQNPAVFKSFVNFLGIVVDEQFEAFEAKNDHIYRSSTLVVSKTIFDALNRSATDLYIETIPWSGILEKGVLLTNWWNAETTEK